MRPKGSAAVLESRRRLAVRMLRSGQPPAVVAKLFGVTRVTLWRWRAAGTLAARPDRGARPRLGRAERAELKRMLSRDPTEHGWSTSLWTSGRVAELIRRRFGVRYHPDHVGRLLRSMGLSSQKPQVFARERDEAAVAHWRRYRWPAVKKSPAGSGGGSSCSTRAGSCSSRRAGGRGGCGAGRRPSGRGTGTTAGA